MLVFSGICDALYMIMCWVFNARCMPRFSIRVGLALPPATPSSPG